MCDNKTYCAINLKTVKHCQCEFNFNNPSVIGRKNVKFDIGCATTCFENTILSMHILSYGVVKLVISFKFLSTIYNGCVLLQKSDQSEKTLCVHNQI